jgi:uncharacterized protein (DUF736 family)
MIIGKFNLADSAYVGTVPALAGAAVTRIAPTDRKGVDYLVTIDGTGIEFGVAWSKTSSKGNDYLSVKLDSPMLPAPANCALIKQADGFALLWNRKEAEDEEAAA